MNILVTGGNGQLGTEIRKNITDKSNWFFLSHDELDITSKRAVKKTVKENNIDVILNCAAYTKFDDCPSNKKTAEKINALGPKILAESLDSEKGLMIHISSDYVFSGERKIGKYKPEDEASPISVYGQTKNLGDEYITNTGVDYLIFRVSWLYGGDRKNFVKTIYDKIGEEATFNVVCDQTGTPTYVGDFAKFLVYILDNFDLQTLKKKCGIYHFANKGKTNWWKLAVQTQKYRKKYDKTFKKDCKIVKIKTEEFPSKDKRPKYSPLSVVKTERTFNYKIKGWKHALRDCIINYIKNE